MDFPLITRLSHELGKPISIIDTETTGLLRGNEVVGIVEIGVLSIFPTGKVEEASSRVNPGVPIPWQASKVHGIYAKDVAYAPEFPAIANDIQSILSDSVVVGFNQRTYDIPVIHQNLLRYGIVGSSSLDSLLTPDQIDVRDIWINISKGQKGKLSEVAQHYGESIKDAHSAMGDIRATAAILESMLWRHGVDFVMKSHILSSQGQERKEASGYDNSQRQLDLRKAGYASDTRSVMTQQLQNDVQNGLIKNRQDVLNALSKFGVLNRVGDDYVSLRLPGRDQSIRFRGPMFEASFSANSATPMPEHNADRSNNAQTLAKAPKGPSNSKIIRDAIWALIKKNYRVTTEDQNLMAMSLDVPVSTISFALSDMYAKKEIEEFVLIDETAQERILARLDQALDFFGDAEPLKLKPIKEYLEQLIGEPVCYIQLRIALNSQVGSDCSMRERQR